MRDIIWVTKHLQGHEQDTFLLKDGLWLKSKLSENGLKVQACIKAAWQNHSFNVAFDKDWKGCFKL